VLAVLERKNLSMIPA